MSKPQTNGVQPLIAEELIERQGRMSKNLLLEHNIKPPKARAASYALDVEPAETTSRKVYETSMANTISNMRQLVFQLETFTPAYNPPVSTLTIEALTAACDEAQALMEASVEKAMEEQQTANSRRTAFEAAQKTATAVMMQFEVCGPPAKSIKDANHWLKMLRGARIIPIVGGDVLANHHSASHKSFVNQAQNFKNFVNVVVNYADYDSNQDALKPAALVELSEALETETLITQQKKAVAKASRIVRNQFFNAPDGFCERGILAKKQVKAMFGSKSAEYLAISHLRFNKIRG